MLLSGVKRHEEAMPLMGRAVSLEPFGPGGGRHSRALKLFRAADTEERAALLYEQQAAKRPDSARLALKTSMLWQWIGNRSKWRE